MQKKFDFNDILIEPEILTNINSRSEVDPFRYGKLPLMTAPMDTVINTENEKYFTDRLIAVLPRGEFTDDKNSFISISLDQMEIFLSDSSFLNLKDYHNILIDIANGHMKKLYELSEKFLKDYPDKILMIGNIANPKTFKLFAELGVHYVRVGIGNGGGCLTTEQLGIGYPMASLIQECYDIAKSINTSTKIVADGGMKKYSDVIKALALGADYVMLGSILNKTLESCATTYVIENNEYKEINQYKEGLEYFKNNVLLYKNFRGMSTKEVQKKWGKDKLSTSEGISKINEVEYTLNGWLDNFESYLRSAMSYTNSLNLEDFKQSRINHITSKSFDRYSK